MTGVTTTVHKSQTFRIIISIQDAVKNITRAVLTLIIGRKQSSVRSKK